MALAESLKEVLQRLEQLRILCEAGTTSPWTFRAPATPTGTSSASVVRPQPTQSEGLMYRRRRGS